MNSNNLNINSAVFSDLDNMDKNINDLENVLSDLYQTLLKLDDTVWKTKEKEKIDQTFIPYIKKFFESYPSYLRIRVQFARNAVLAHQKLDEENSGLEDII